MRPHPMRAGTAAPAAINLVLVMDASPPCFKDSTHIEKAFFSRVVVVVEETRKDVFGNSPISLTASHAAQIRA